MWFDELQLTEPWCCFLYSAVPESQRCYSSWSESSNSDSESFSASLPLPLLDAGSTMGTLPGLIKALKVIVCESSSELKAGFPTEVASLAA